MKYLYHTIVIGAGSGGLTVAQGLAAAGKQVALIERAKIGGDCTNSGCIPSKALLDIAHSGKYTFLEALRETRKRRQVIQDEETPERIENKRLKVYLGSGSFRDSHTIAIDNQEEITGKYIVLATGSHASMIEIDGVHTGDILTNESIFELKKDIQHLVILGGGYIGCEMADAFSALGVEITIIQRNERILPREEEESSENIKKMLESRGVKIYTSTSIERCVDREIVIKTEKGKIQKIPYDKILIALGREANITGLHLENTKIITQKGIVVDRYNRTKEKHIFAIGDVVEGNPQFTHLANHEGRGVVRNILIPFWKSSSRNTTLPSVLYTKLEVARVGKTEKDLIDQIGKEAFHTEILYFDRNDRSRVTEDEVGYIKMHFSRLTGKILGTTIVGSHAGEMISIVTLAMVKGIHAYGLSGIIFPYPTKSEIIKKAASKYVVYTLSHLRLEILYWLKFNSLQIATLILWISIIGTYLYLKNMYDLSNLDLAKAIYIFLSTSFWGPILYIFIYAVRPIVFFPATLMTFMSGALFGIWGGFLYTMIGENMSANVSYGIGRIFGKRIIPEGSSGVLSILKSKFEKDSFIPVLLTRFLFFPFDLTNYAAGILGVKWSGFFWATLLGIIPGALVFIIAGASIENIETFDLSEIRIDYRTILFSIAIFVFSLILARILRRYEKR